MDHVDDRVHADGARDLQRREVQRLAERLPERHGSVLLQSRVPRVVAIGRGPFDVIQARRRREPELLHAGEVCEQLERRSGLAVRDAGMVVVALHRRRAAVVVVRADVREHLAGRRIHGDERGVVHVERLQPVDVVAHFLLGELLHVPVEACVHGVATAVGGLLAKLVDELLAHPEHEVRRVQRGRRRPHDDRLRVRDVGLGGRDVAVVDHRVQHGGAPGLRSERILCRVVCRWQLRKPREQRHLRERQLAQVSYSEVGRRGGSDAIGLVAVIDLVQVHLEDLFLAERARRLEREDRLLDLPCERRLVSEQARLDELLRDRRASLTDRAALRVRGEGADDPADINAGVRPERAVLDRDRRLLKAFGHPGERDQVTTLVLERVQKMLAGAVVDPRRQRNGERRQVMRGREVGRQRGDRREQHEAEDRADAEDGRAEAPGEWPESPRRSRVARGRADTAGGNLVSVPVCGPLEEGHYPINARRPPVIRQGLGGGSPSRSPMYRQLVVAPWDPRIPVPGRPSLEE